MNSDNTYDEHVHEEDRQFTVALCRPSIRVSVPQRQMLRADLCPSARCLVPLAIANAELVSPDQAFTLTPDAAAVMTGGTYHAAFDELARVGLLCSNTAGGYSFCDAPLAGYAGPRDPAQASRLYGDEGVYSAGEQR